MHRRARKKQKNTEDDSCSDTEELFPEQTARYEKLQKEASQVKRLHQNRQQAKAAGGTKVNMIDAYHRQVQHDLKVSRPVPIEPPSTIVDSSSLSTSPTNDLTERFRSRWFRTVESHQTTPKAASSLPTLPMTVPNREPGKNFWATSPLCHWLESQEKGTSKSWSLDPNRKDKMED